MEKKKNFFYGFNCVLAGLLFFLALKFPGMAEEKFFNLYLVADLPKALDKIMYFILRFGDQVLFVLIFLGGLFLFQKNGALKMFIYFVGLWFFVLFVGWLIQVVPAFYIPALSGA